MAAALKVNKIWLDFRIGCLKLCFYSKRNSVFVHRAQASGLFHALYAFINSICQRNAKTGIDFIFIHSNSVKLKMDDVHLTSVFMKFEKEGQSYEIPLTGHKVILQPNTSTIAFRARDQTLSVTTRSTQIELYFEQTKEDHEVKKFSR